MTGIYMLTNVKTGNRYVGKSINIPNYEIAFI